MSSMGCEGLTIRISGVAEESVVDGPGLRYAVFAQGCPHHCPGCHNPQTHDPLGGREESVAALAAAMGKNPLLSGLTLTGGEPLLQPEACAYLAQAARSMGLSVWIYTGFVWEDLLKDQNEAVLRLLRRADVLVDGRFEQKLRSLELAFRGSSNQRLIDVQKSLRSGSVVLYTPPSW